VFFTKIDRNCDKILQIRLDFFKDN